MDAWCDRRSSVATYSISMASFYQEQMDASFAIQVTVMQTGTLRAQVRLREEQNESYCSHHHAVN